METTVWTMTLPYCHAKGKCFAWLFGMIPFFGDLFSWSELWQKRTKGPCTPNEKIHHAKFDQGYQNNGESRRENYDVMDAYGLQQRNKS